MKKKQIIGYTTGVYDLFHVGHLNLLKRAKNLCDKLIVGVTTDEFVKEYKNKYPVIPFEERLEIIENIKYVDAAIAQENFNKVEMCKKLKVDYVFVGDDWYNSERWTTYEKDLKKIGVEVIYLPYTKTTSSTKLTLIINSIIDEIKKEGK